MSKALVDSNILIDFLKAIPAARDELARYSEPSISIVSWIEVMSGVAAEEEAVPRNFLAKFERIELTTEVADRAAAIRRERRIKLPDAIIQATAEVKGLLLITRNERDFPEGTPGVRVPYRV